MFAIVAWGFIAARHWNPSWCMAIVGVVTFAIGTLHYLRRTEPEDHPRR
jgi:hypothetical protein